MSCQFVGDRDKIYTYRNFPPAVKISVFAVSCFSLIILFSTVATLRYYWEHPVVIRVSFMVSCAWLLGSIIMVFDCILLVADATKEICAIHWYTLYIGSCLLIGCPLVKSYRIAQIFETGSARQLYIPDIRLLQYIACGVFFDIVLVTVYNFVWLFPGELEIIEDGLDRYTRCTAKGGDWFIIVFGVIVLAEISLLAYYAYATRNAWETYKDKNWLLSMSLICAINFLLITILEFATRNGWTTELLWRACLAVISLILAVMTPLTYFL